jgi:hypothetical protein
MSVAAPGVPGDGDAAPVEAPREAGNGGFDEVQLVDAACQVLDPEAPDLRVTGIVGRDVQLPRVEVGGLNDHETVGGPEVDQRGVAVQRLAEAVREDDDGQFVAGHRGRHPHLHVLAAARGRQHHRAYRDDRKGRADDSIGVLHRFLLGK